MNIATSLTLARLLLGPVFAFTFIAGFNGSRNWLWASLGALIVSELTDAFDGYFARSRSQVTDFGKVFDPVADSLSRLTAFLAFTFCGIVPLWMYLIFMYRDSLMALLRIICAAKGLVLAARPSGKLKAIFQAIAIFGILAVALAHAYAVPWVPRTIAGFHPGFWLMVFPALFTAVSIFDYLIPNWEKVKSMMIPVK